MTCRSCIASSSAACVLGGVRLISSASTTLAKIGPVHELQLPRAAGAVLLQHFGAGDVAGHQVGRELDALEVQRQALGQRAHHQRLGQARHAFEDAVPAGEDADQQLIEDLVLPHDHAGKLLPERLMGSFQTRASDCRSTSSVSVN